MISLGGRKPGNQRGEKQHEIEDKLEAAWANANKWNIKQKAMGRIIRQLEMLDTPVPGSHEKKKVADRKEEENIDNDNGFRWLIMFFCAALCLFVSAEFCELGSITIRSPFYKTE